MKIVFYASNKLREVLLAEAFRQGMKRHGYEVTILESDGNEFVEDADLACMVGVKSLDLWNKCKNTGIVPVMFDKGYTRSKNWAYWRVSVGSHQPTAFSLINARYDNARIRSLMPRPLPKWRRVGGHIVILGSSAKCHEFLGIEDPTAWATNVVKELRQHTNRDIVYRPKPSWRGSVPIKGTHLSNSASLDKDLRWAWAAVTYSSSACIEAAAAGIPTIVLGDAVMKPISSTDLSEINDPVCGKRDWLFANLSYHQWTLAEIENGSMWNTMRDWL